MRVCLRLHGTLHLNSHSEVKGCSEFSLEDEASHSAPAPSPHMSSLLEAFAHCGGQTHVLSISLLGNQNALLQKQSPLSGVHSSRERKALGFHDPGSHFPTFPLKSSLPSFSFVGLCTAWCQAQVSEAISFVPWFLLKISTTPCFLLQAGLEPSTLLRGWGQTGKQWS